MEQLYRTKAFPEMQNEISNIQFNQDRRPLSYIYSCIDALSNVQTNEHYPPNICCLPTDENASPNENRNVKVFFGNLAPVTTEKNLYNLFEPFGNCSGLIILKDRKQRPRGAGFVTFSSEKEAQAAISALDKKIILSGAHKPLEVRFPENDVEKRDRIRSLKCTKDKTATMRSSNDNGSSASLDSEPDYASLMNACSACGTENVQGGFCLDCARHVYS
ncbi:Rna recognition motif-containing protein [Cardiosporidium cionae]|uniref:Rna recognition motif-containing protein n=1 Tax=Cardiosporidium cionae TaxID=476202 RepID=A0ABQ7JE96_9APIC|nr:Rna recognition motif-containing protein [Cardiosporidium cionae]|eukprot:KAF8822332.1 Rna recognition motif-containing protein [Cardiosporidium cionae]